MSDFNVNKYMGIDYFYEMLLKKKYMLKRPDQWDDPYENFIGNFFDDEKKYQDLYCFCKKLSNDFYNKISENAMLMKLWLCSQAFVCTCFTYENSLDGIDAMWRSYSYDRRSIRFSYFDPFLKEAQYTKFLETGEPYMGCNKVKYEKFDVWGKVKHIILTDKIVPTEFIFAKRLDFEYEKEIRIFAREPVKDSTINLMISENFNLYDFSNLNNFINFTKREIADNFPEKVPYDIENKNIRDIVVNPLANESVKFMADQICEKFGLGEARISNLYNFKY